MNKICQVTNKNRLVEEGKKIIGLTLDWDCVKREVRTSMPGCVPKALIKFGHKLPKRIAPGVQAWAVRAGGLAEVCLPWLLDGHQPLSQSSRRLAWFTPASRR